MKPTEKLMPELRFSVFKGNWKISEMAKHTLSSAFGPRFSSELYARAGNIVTLRTTDMDDEGNLCFDNAPLAVLNEKKFQEHLLQKNDLVVSRSGTIGITGIFEEYKLPVLPGAFLIRFRLSEKTLNPNFVQLYFNSQKGRKKLLKLSAGGVQKNLKGSSILKMLLNIPTLPEQQKIASFLLAVDKKIEKLTRKKDLLEKYKKGMMQKIFSQEIRFKDENGKDFPDWVEKRLGDVFQRSATKNNENNQNVLTASAQSGLINQKEFFNKSVSAKDVTGYYLLNQGDFVYNKSYCKGYPMGAIKRLNRYEKGVVSPIYICFKLIRENDPIFYEKFFDHGGVNKDLHKIAQEGVRNHGLLNVGIHDFFKDLRIPKPCLVEQQKIANSLSSMDKTHNPS